MPRIHPIVNKYAGWTFEKKLLPLKEEQRYPDRVWAIAYKGKHVTQVKFKSEIPRTISSIILNTSILGESNGRSTESSK